MKKIPSKFTALRRELDNTIYAYTCNGCGQSWKIYQKQYHGEDCPYDKTQQIELESPKKKK